MAKFCKSIIRIYDPRVHYMCNEWSGNYLICGIRKSVYIGDEINKDDAIRWLNLYLINYHVLGASCTEQDIPF